MVSSLWGQSPCPWKVKVDSVIVQELLSSSTSNSTANICGWIVETRRPGRDHTDNLTTRTGSKTMTEKLSWQLDYRAISVYKPCTDSSLETTDKII